MALPPLQDATEVTEATGDALAVAGRFAAAFLGIYLIGRFLVVPAVARVVRRRNRDNPTIQNAVERYLHLSVFVVAVVAGAAAAGYVDVLARSAIIVAAATIAVGVAGQEVIGNLVSGLFLVADRNFSVGDWIAWDGDEGVVEAISFRTTRVRTPDNEVLTVPNTELTTSAITRPYTREEVRVTETIEVAYGDDVEAAMATLRAVADERGAILDEPEPRVYLQELGDDGVALRLQYWIGDPSRRGLLRVRSEVARAIKARFEEAGLTISPASERELSGRIGVDRAAESITRE